VTCSAASCTSTAELHERICVPYGATAKVERTNQRGNGDRNQGRERQAERGDFTDPAPF
jgi:hypothetical protein